MLNKCKLIVCGCYKNHKKNNFMVLTSFKKNIEVNTIKLGLFKKNIFYCLSCGNKWEYIFKRTLGIKTFVNDDYFKYSKIEFLKGDEKFINLTSYKNKYGNLVFLEYE